ncbi:MAG TPA: hypothetical protein VHO84_11835 [Syntrophorhabdaceae bacterium]|nr:hypothetical protein [Syntrophorhabdaceae bacterium]
MIQNKIVVHCRDGRIIKGATSDFLPTRSVFHVSSANGQTGEQPIEVRIQDVKAIFFVKDFVGNSARKDEQKFPDRPIIGRKIKIEFKDGEVMIGTTQGYDPNRDGFFIVPADADSNNERCFIVVSATNLIQFV